MKIEISEDTKLAKIQLNDTYSAEELEELISGLGELRSDMSPSVPMQSPLATKSPFATIAVEEDPTFDIRPLPNQPGGVRLLMRSSALGWTAYDISPRNASALGDWLRDNCVGVSTLEEADIKSPPQ